MKVAGFMTPAAKVVTALPEDSIRRVMDLMLQHNISAVVVVKYEYKRTDDDSPDETLFMIPLGIITKSDLLLAYHEPGININHPCRVIMSDHLTTCSPNMDRDEAAAILESSKNHHAIVMDDSGYFQGLVSSWDITAECAKDHRAWPWIRSEDGKFHDPQHRHVEKPSTTAHHPDSPKSPDSGNNIPPADCSFRAQMEQAGIFHPVL
mmetsp:Transcript_10328/g.19824  ORF Transcript_10328/g.19824 Transcript_10328/m.19824 type:complete len:207 (-) Transcript_10328:184-804(-)|eukprot:scaffold4884_cov165-Amphora_coffeaeformis.AAC.10